MKPLHLLFIFFILNLVTKAQTGLHFQWHKNSVSGTPYVMHKDSFINRCRVGQSVSNDNVIAVLNPGNSAWYYYASSPVTPSVMPEIIMRTRNNGIMYSAFPTAYYTTDGFQTSTQFTLTAVPKGATSAGFYGYSISSPYMPMFSSDGINWTTASTSSLYPGFSESKNKLFNYRGDRMHVSTDGGMTYSVINYTTTISAGKFHTPSDDTLYLITTNDFKRSFDGGNTWMSATLPSTATISQSACRNGKEILLYYGAGFTKYMHYSNDCGNTWSSSILSFPTFGITNILMATEDYFMIYPDYKSVDGVTWTAMYPNKYGNAMDVNFTGSTGLVGFEDGYFAYSTNKGVSFDMNPAKISSNEDLMAVKVLPNGKFLVGDRKGQVFESSNNGQTWSQKFSSISNINAYKFSCSANSATIVCSRAGQPLMSIDGGNTYSIVTAGGGQHFQTLKPGSGQMVDVGGSYPPPNFTLTGWDINGMDINGNKTLLTSITSSTAANEQIVDIQMADDNTGYLILRNTATMETNIYKTTNGWSTAAFVGSIPSGVPAYNLYSGKLQIFGTDTLVLSGSGSAVGNAVTFYHYSVNGGATWTQVNTNFTVPNANLGNRVYRMHFFNTGEFMALISDNYSGPSVTSVGAYLSVNGVTGSSSIGINELQEKNNSGSVKIYPNPALGSTGFSIKSEEKFNYVELYDVSGRLVSRISETLSDHVRVESTGLTNGIYFVKLFNNSGACGSARLVICEN